MLKAAFIRRRERGTTRKEPPSRIGGWSLTGMGIGGIIGAGYFLGSGIAIRQAGPSVVLTYILGALIMAQVMGGLASMALAHPHVTAYRDYIAQYLGTYTGYMLGWAVLISGIVGLGSEAVATATYARYWVSWPLMPLAIGFALLALATNLLGTRWIGRMEAGMSIIKVAALLGFVGVGILAVIGHADVHHAWGPQLLGSSAVFPHGIGGMLAATLIVVFSYSGITTVAMATGRARHPALDIPRAAVATVVGVSGLYVAGMIILLMLIPWNAASVSQSPFSQALQALSMGWTAPLAYSDEVDHAFQ